MLDCSIQQRIEVGHGLHQLHAVGQVCEALVHLQKGHDLLDVPEVLGRALPLDLAVHRHLEQDGAQDAISIEGGAGDDAAAHLMNAVVHLLIICVRRGVQAVQRQSLGRAATALIKRGDEALAGLHLRQLSLIHNLSFIERRVPHSRQPALHCRQRRHGESVLGSDPRHPRCLHSCRPGPCHRAARMR